MFLFSGRGKARSGEPVQQAGLSPAEDLYSSPAATALAALDYSGVDAKATPPPSTGRRLVGSDIAIQLDELRDDESVVELKVQTITLVKTELKLEQTQKVAVSDAYICYGLKPGHIRALDRDTGRRALFRGHPTSISYMAVFSASNNLLASVSRQGDIAVRYLQDAPDKPDDEAIKGSMRMSAQLSGADLQGTPDSPFAPVTLAWHPTVPQILAAGAGSSVHIYEVPTNAPSGGAAPPPSEPGITYSIADSSSSGAVVTGVAFTPSGDLLVAGDSAGGVHAWWLEGEDASEAPLLSWSAVQDTTTGSSSNGIGSISVLHQAADGSSLVLTGNASNSTLWLWVLPAAAPAAAARGAAQPVQLQTVSFKGKDAAFCHVNVQPELQLVVLADTARRKVYTLHYSLDAVDSVGHAAAGAAAASARLDYAAFFSVKQPILSCTTILEPGSNGEQQLLLCCVQTDAIQSYLLTSSMCTAGAAEPEPDSDQEAKASKHASNTAADTASEAAAAAALPAAVADVTGSTEPEADSVAAAATAAEVPPPAQLPTPSLLAARAAAQHHKATASEAAAVPSPTKPEGGPQEQSAAAAVTAAANQEVAQQLPQAAAGASATVVEADGSEAPMPPMPTFSLMHSAEKAPPAAAAEQQPAAHTPKADAAGQPRDDLLAGSAAAAAAAGVAASLSTPAAAAGVSGAELAGLQQQMAKLLQMQEHMASQLQASSQQTVAGVKSELGRSLKSTEASLFKQIEAVLKASAKKAEDDRRKGAAKERQELEKILGEQLSQLTSSLHRELSKVVLDTAREQARAAVNATVNAVTPAVASAVSASLQQELAGGSLQVLLEQSLANSLAAPLHDALRSNFDASLIPAFERATRVMFTQVESAFNSWLADSSKAVSAAQADAASSLSSTLAQLQAVVSSMRTDLADTSRSLNKLASTTASRAAAAEPGAAAGAAAVAGVGAGAGVPRVSGGAAAVVQQDPRAEIGALLARRDLEGALVTALNTVSPDILLWTCTQIDPAAVLSGASLNLSQTTLLSLVQQLSANLISDSNTPLKLAWLAEAAPAVDPHDPVTEPHLRGVLTSVMNSLKQLVLSLPQTDAMAKKGKITLHLFNSLLHQ